MAMRRRGRSIAPRPYLCLAPPRRQVCAAGALLNIMGPDLDAGDCGPRATRRALGHVMSLILAAAMLHDAVWEKRPEVV
eukprot:364401-Chlamydomonas_euryale.AAC.5